MLVEMGKKYQTRDGQPVRILCIDGPDKRYPVVGFIEGYSQTHNWMADGRWNSPKEGRWINPIDLVPVPEKHEAWALISLHSGSVTSYRYHTREEAESDCGFGEAVVHLEWED